MREIGMGIVLLFSLLNGVPFSAKLIITELKEKTVYPLLAKPVTRFHLVMSKFTAAALVSCGSFSLFYLLFVAASIVKGDSIAVMMIVQVFLFFILMLILLSAMVICFSVYCTFSTTVTISYLIYFLMIWFGPTIRSMTPDFPLIGNIMYYLMPHFEFFDLRHRLIHNWEILPLWIVAFVVMYTVIFSGMFISMAYMGLKKRWL